ncbi:MAG: trigger factor [Anaerolineae bacterium]
MFEVKKEILDSHEALLEVVFEEQTVEEAKRRAARSIAGEISIPGFRRGRAPYAKVVQYVGEAAILQEAAEQLLDDTYAEILEKADISPGAPGEFVDMETDPLTFKLRVPLEPQVELGDYAEMREDWEGPTVSDEEVDQVLEQVREENAVLEPVDRPAEMGDQVILDVHATVDGDVIVDEDDIEVTLAEDRPFLSPEFVEAILGMVAEEEKSVRLTLPETIDEPSLRGVEADFTIEVSQVYERHLPDLDDALASTVGSFETFDELQQDIHDRILSSKQQQVETAYRNKLIRRLVEEADIDYPPQMVEDALDEIVEETRQQIQRQQQLSLEDALRLQGQTLEQFREQMEPQAVDRVRRSLALSEFASEEGIQVSDDEIVQAYSDLLVNVGVPQMVDESRVDIESDLGRSLRSSVLGRKVMERLMAIARGEVEEAGPEEAGPEEGEPGVESAAAPGAPVEETDQAEDIEEEPVTEEVEEDVSQEGAPGETASDEGVSDEDEADEESSDKETGSAEDEVE